MIQSKYLISVLSILFILSACQTSDFENEKLIGSWKVSEWKVEKTGEMRSNKMDMNFDADGNYEIDYGSQKEKGKYWLASNFLHTVETDKAEMKVKILKLNVDTFRIQMNRGGMIENVLLIKSNK